MGRLFKRGKKYYVDVYKTKTDRLRRSVGTDRRVAEQVLKDVEVKIIKGEYLGIYEDKKITIKDFSGEYLSYMETQVTPKSFRRAKDMIHQHLIPNFPQYLSKITTKDVEGYIGSRLQKIEPASVNREVTRLKHLLNKAVERRYISKNPIEEIKPLKEPPGRVRYLDEDEFQLLLSGCKDHWLEPLIFISLNTGLRRSELLQLGWKKNVDLKNNRITLFKTKNNKMRSVALNETLSGLLRKFPRRIDTDLLFPNITGDMVSMAFRRLCQQIGIKDFHWHDLRHNFASYLAMNSYDIRTIQELLGHSDIRMTIRYSHLSPKHLQNAVNSLDTLFVKMGSANQETVMK